MAPKNNSRRRQGFTNQKGVQKRMIPPVHQHYINIGDRLHDHGKITPRIVNNGNFHLLQNAKGMIIHRIKA
ncbi:MAG: hypothetical protein PHV34_04045 [Verrucomicrobiae bacterium]|nr:hypothetical protein [Verrucomicrobiae bacterium]